jgi:cyclopropane fatty-acyl-phospholipid synthase-like methyltransferase
VTAFDAAAPHYDEVARSELGQALRDRVHELLSDVVVPGARLLDLGGGTGLDARRYLDRGASVTSVEGSSAMADIARARLGDDATVIHADVTTVELDDRYDVVVSNFGMVNCVADLDPLARRLEQWCVPGGTLLLVVMGRCAPWEIVGGVRHLDWSRATRRWRGVDGDVRYWSPGRVHRSVRQAFAREQVKGLGVALPTFEQRSVVQNRQRLLGALAAVDRAVSPVAGRLGVGDHWIGRWRRR